MGYPPQGSGGVLPSKFPFWSAIITQNANTVSVAGSSTSTVYIQPAAGETWLLWIDFGLGNYNPGSYVAYCDYDGTTLRQHTVDEPVGTYANKYPVLHVAKILTNSLYAALRFNNSSPSAYTGYYGYSGFKLSKPLWSSQRLDPSPRKPFKLSTDLPLPDPIKPLDKYKALILGLDPSKPFDYALGVILEEDTPLAVDPATGFPVERKSAYVSATTLANLITQFKSGQLDYVKAGYEPYLKKWKAEGIDFGIV